MEDQNKKSNKVGWSIMGVVVIVLAALGVVFLNKKPADQVSSTDQNLITTPVDTNTGTPSGKKTVYKSGTYSADGSYNSPAGEETVSVTLTLVNDVITDATVVGQATSPESREYQKKFISGFKQYVVGKNIDEVNVTKVSGSSLTPEGFNDALTKIKAQAKA